MSGTLRCGIFCALVAALLPLGTSGLGHVEQLTEDDFDRTLKKNQRVLVEFYAPWCGHCQMLAPEYDKAAWDLKAAGSQTLLAKVDCTLEKKLAKRFDVKGYPTLIYFVKGKKGPEFPANEKARTAYGIVEWLKERELYNFLTESEAQKFVKQLKPGEFGLLATVKEGSARAKTFWNAVDVELRKDRTFTFSPAAVQLPAGADANRGAALTLWRPHFEAPDPVQVQFKGRWTEADIVKWARKRAYPSLDFGYDPRKHAWSTVESVGLEGMVVVVLPGDNVSDTQRSQVREALAPLLSKHAAWRFTAAAVGSLPPERRQALGFRGPPGPAVAVVQRRAFALEGVEDVLDPATLANFLDNVKAGKAKPVYKSELPPASPVEDGITILTGDLFEKVVLDPARDVLVFFYSPDCEPCKEEVLPVLKLLTQKAVESGWQDLGLVIGKFDGTRNDCQEEILGYPKLVIYPAVEAGQKMEQRRAFSGKFTLDAVAAFVLLHGRGLVGARSEL